MRQEHPVVPQPERELVSATPLLGPLEGPLSDSTSALRRLWLFILSILGQAQLRNTAWLAGGEGAYRGSRLVLTILFARSLGAEEFGKWSVALALGLLIAAVADFGLSTMTLRDLAVDQSQARRYAGNVVKLKAWLGLAGLASALALGLLLGSDSEAVLVIFLLGVFALLTAYGEFFYAIFRAFGRMELEAFSKVIFGASLLALAGGLLWISAPLPALAAAFIIAAMVSVSFALIAQVICFGGLDFRTIPGFARSSLRVSFPIFLANVAFVAYFRIDIIMLGQMKGELETGLYSAAFNFVTPWSYLPMLFVAALFPVLSRQVGSLSQSRKSYLLATIALVAYVALVAAVLIGSRDVLYLRIMGAQYQDSAPLIPVLAGTMFLFTLAHLNYFFLYAKKRDGAVLMVTLASVVVNVVLNLLLIPSFGMQGAAFSTVATQAVVLGTLLFYNRELVPALWGRIESHQPSRQI